MNEIPHEIPGSVSEAETTMPFEVRDLGGCLLPNLDNTAEVLAVAEGDTFRRSS